jgi:hypothetical protein
MEESAGTGCSVLSGPASNHIHLIFPALYNGPVNYYARLVRQQEIVLEQYDSYSKQTYRNRCMIMGPNGLVTLSIPVKRKRNTKTYLRDIRIDYDIAWNRIHWRSLVASYASSPFFDYMAEEFNPLYQKRVDFLIEMNLKLIDKTLELLGLRSPVVCTEAFSPILSDHDPRHFIHPKMDQAEADPGFQPEEYYQVFADRLGFRANLSILDLIFNEGPEALSYLQRCLRT